MFLQNQNILIDGTKISPYILFDLNKGLLKMKGRSLSNNSKEIFDKVSIALENVDCTKNLEVEFQLDYLNTSSTKSVFLLFKKMKHIKSNSNVNLNINWHSSKDDEEMIELGEDIEDLTGLEFNYILT